MKGRRTLFFLALFLAAVAAVTAYFALDLGQYFTLDYLKARQHAFQAYRAARPLQAIGLFFGVYVLFTSLALPGAALLSLAGGALFGLLAGTLIVSFASTIGATCAFLISRHFLRDWTRRHFRKQAELIDANVARDGAFYLLSLRLMPLFPFTLKNLLVGLTSIPTWTYYWVSQLGMLPATLAYVNAGTQLSGIDSLSDILSPAVLASFAALGLMPLAARMVLKLYKVRKVYRVR
jgi:uncharacterized membrane protein YdjX (TVP38/TMEM64 family)